MTTGMKKFNNKVICVLSQIGTVNILMCLLSLFCFSSCSEYLKGKPYKTEYLQIQSDGKLDCLEDVSADMQKFLKSEGTNEEIDQTVTCINTTLTELQVKVEGTVEAASFTADDVYNILAKFASATQISRTAAQNLLTLKAALIGGDSVKITKGEIDSLKKLLLIVKDEAKKIRPYVKLFYFNNTEKLYTKEYIAEGFAQLNATLKIIYKQSQLINSDYSVENFKEMMSNVLNLSEENRSIANIVAKLSKVISGTHDVLSDSERLIYIDNITEFFRLYSLYSNGFAKFEVTNSGNLKDTFDFVEAAVNLLENSLQYRKTQIITTQTLDGLVSALTASNFLTYKITAYNAAIAYRTVLVRVFESGAKGNILAYTGIKPINIRNIRKELATYRIYSNMIEHIAGEKLFASLGIVSSPLTDLQYSFAQLDIASETEILNRFDSTLKTQIINNVNDLRSEFLEASPIIYYNNKIGIATNQNTWKQKWQDLARGIYIKMLSRLVMQGWGQIYPFENISTNYMTESDLFNWYSELKSIGIEIKLFDPRRYNAGSASFNAANLFTRIGNGDDKVKFKEVAESMGIVFSSSAIFYYELKADLLSNNCNLPETDVFGENWNYESCFQQTIKEKYKKYFAALPHLIAYLNTLDDIQFTKYFQSALEVVRIETANSGSRVETSDIFSMNNLLHFIEEIYVVHDTNANWMISESEIRVAYPKFEKMATNFAHQTAQKSIDDFTSWMGDVGGYGCFSEKDLIRESFIFLIYNGRMPEQSDFNSFPCFQGKPLMNFHGEVDRMRMIKTFNALKSALGV